MQATGNFVTVRVKLAARVQLRHHNFSGGNALLGVLINRNAAAIVDDGDRVVEVDRDTDLRAMAREMLVNRVIDDFVNEMMEALFAR